MKGPFPYVGGKVKIAKQIIALFPVHRTYVETFSGGAQLLFQKEPSSLEILNDIDGDVIGFFRTCQAHYEELVRYLRFVLVSREWFDRLLAQNPNDLTDIQRAARFFYLQKNAYAGLVRKRRFGYAIQGPTRFNPERIPELIENTHKRLASVQIERLPYQEVFKRYDRPETFFYCDPPYHGLKLYNVNLSEREFLELSKRLRELRGKFILSINDVPPVRRIFSGFYVREIQIAYTAQRTAGKRFRELLIANYPFPKAGEDPT